MQMQSILVRFLAGQWWQVVLTKEDADADPILLVGGVLSQSEVISGCFFVGGIFGNSRIFQSFQFSGARSFCHGAFAVESFVPCERQGHSCGAVYFPTPAFGTSASGHP